LKEIGPECGQIDLDRSVEVVENVVEPFGRADPLAVAMIKRVESTAQHGFERSDMRNASRAAPATAIAGVSRAAGSR
jgi:hypothetical protein